MGNEILVAHTKMIVRLGHSFKTLEQFSPGSREWNKGIDKPLPCNGTRPVNNINNSVPRHGTYSEDTPPSDVLIAGTLHPVPDAGEGLI